MLKPAMKTPAWAMIPLPIRQLQILRARGKVSEADLTEWMHALLDAIALYVSDRRVLAPLRRAFATLGGNPPEGFAELFRGGFARLMASAIENGDVHAEPVLPPDEFGLTEAASALEAGKTPPSGIVLDLLRNLTGVRTTVLKSWLAHRMITGIDVDNSASDTRRQVRAQK